MEAVEPDQMARILDLTDRLGIHRESVTIPLGRRGEGGVRRLPNGKLEIVVAAGVDFDAWLAGLESRIRAAGG